MLRLVVCSALVLSACSAWHVPGDLGQVQIEDLSRNLPWRDGKLSSEAQIVAIESESAAPIGPIRLQLRGRFDQLSVAVRDGANRTQFDLADYLPEPSASEGDAVAVIPLASSRAELTFSGGAADLAVVSFDRATDTPHSRFETEDLRIDLRLAAQRTADGWHLRLSDDLSVGGAIALTLSASQAAGAGIEQTAIRLRGDGDRAVRLGVRPRPGGTSILVQPHVWLDDATDLVLSSPDLSLNSLEVVGDPDPADGLATTSVAALIELGEESLGSADYVVYRWFEYPELLWFDSRDYRIQADLFRRLAFFVEKDGFRGRLLTDQELVGRTGWNGHNYRAESLAAFFNLAAEQNFPLNRREQELRELLIEAGTLIAAPNGLQPGPGGVLTVSQESPPGLRRLLVIHEAAHGVFYQEDAFRNAMFDHWRNDLAEWEREYWRELFHFISYDPDDEYLMVNEFQAYLLQRPRAEAIWDVGTRWAGRLNIAGRARQALAQPERLRGAIERSAQFVDQRLIELTGFQAGALERLYRLP